MDILRQCVDENTRTALRGYHDEKRFRMMLINTGTAPYMPQPLPKNTLTPINAPKLQNQPARLLLQYEFHALEVLLRPPFLTAFSQYRENIRGWRDTWR